MMFNCYLLGSTTSTGSMLCSNQEAGMSIWISGCNKMSPNMLYKYSVARNYEQLINNQCHTQSMAVQDILIGCAPNCYIRLVSGLHFATSLLHALNSVEVANFLDNNTIHHLMQFGVLCNLMCRGSVSRNFSSNS